LFERGIDKYEIADKKWGLSIAEEDHEDDTHRQHDHTCHLQEGARKHPLSLQLKLLTMQFNRSVGFQHI